MTAPRKETLPHELLASAPSILLRKPQPPTPQRPSASMENSHAHNNASLVRSVEPDDRQGLVDLLRLRHAEFGLGRYDPDRVTATLKTAIDRTGFLFVGVIAGGTLPEATIGLALARWWDEADFHLEAIWDYVHPDHRASVRGQGGHANHLRRFAMMSADKLGVPLFMGGPMRAGSEGRMRGYCRRMRPAGVFFLYTGPGMEQMTGPQRVAAAAGLMRAFEPPKSRTGAISSPETE